MLEFHFVFVRRKLVLLPWSAYVESLQDRKKAAASEAYGHRGSSNSQRKRENMTQGAKKA
jgi:hypothetical protein